MLQYIKRLSLTVLSLCTLALVAVSTGHAEQRYDEHQDPIAYTALQMSGVIDQIVEKKDAVRQLIIDDNFYVLDSDCILRNRYGRLVAFSSLIVGMQVSFYAIDHHTITKLWHDPVDGEDAAVPPSSRKAGGTSGADGTLRFEDGVWKN